MKLRKSFRPVLVMAVEIPPLEPGPYSVKMDFGYDRGKPAGVAVAEFVLN